MPGAFNHLYDDFDRFAGVNAIEGEDQAAAAPGEVRRAAFGLLSREGRSNSAFEALDPHVQARADLYEKLTGEDGDFMRRHNGVQELQRRRIRGLIDAGELFQDENGVAQGTTQRARGTLGAEKAVIRALFEIDRLSALHPGEFLTDQEIDLKVADELRIQREEDESVLARAKGFRGGLNQFLGAGGAALTDPMVLATLPVGFGTISGPSIALNAGKAFFSEAAIAGLVEIPIQAEVFQFKDRIDSPYSFREAAFNVLAATLGAGVVRAGGSVTIDVASNALTRFNASRASKAPTPEQQRAVDELETYVRDAEQNPVGVENEPAHLDALDQAAADIEAGRAPDVDALVGDLDPIDADPHIPTGRMFLADDIETFDPRELEIDAELFQFKAGGDEEGVTRAFKDIDEFRIEQAGQVIVYEDLGGKRFIVDGHQRMGIARRALDGGQDPDTVKLFGVRLREADGVTVDSARRMAAFKNIAEGTGSGIDAAKVMRGLSESELAGMPQLPRAGVIASRGQSLARLGDDSFMAVVNELVPEDQAAIVGELVADTVLQKASIDTLARVQPANQVQAREVIKQVREAGATVQESGDLFGDALVETLVLERAKVVDDALRTLRTESRTFKTLVQRQETIEGAGKNVLDPETNLQQVLDNAKASEILQREAHQKGPISEAVQAAAERLKTGESRRSVTESFLRDFQTAATRRDAPGIQPGEARAAEAPDIVEDNTARPAAPADEPSNPVDLAGSQATKADELGRLSDENERIVDELLAEVDKKFGTESNSSRKTKESIINKANRPSILAKKPWFNVEYLRDSFRFRTVVTDINDIERVFAFMQENAATRGVEILKVDIEKQLNPGEWGWRMVAIDMQMPNKQIVEFYSPVTELRQAQGGNRPGQVFDNHELFEKWRVRDITALSPEERVAYLADLEESRKWYQEGWDAYLARTNQTEADVSSSLNRLVASLSPARTKKEAISSPVRDMPGDELQPESVLKKKPSRDITTAETGRLPGSRKTETIASDIGTTSKTILSDLGGPVDRQAQDLADATRAKDEARQGARDVDVGEGEFFGQGGRLEADLFDETGPLSAARRDADLFTDDEAEAIIGEAADILNDQDIDLPVEIVKRGDEEQLVGRSGRELFDELDEADQTMIDLATCHRGAA